VQLYFHPFEVHLLAFFCVVSRSRALFLHNCVCQIESCSVVFISRFAHDVDANDNIYV